MQWAKAFLTPYILKSDTKGQRRNKLTAQEKIICTYAVSFRSEWHLWEVWHRWKRISERLSNYSSCLTFLSRSLDDHLREWRHKAKGTGLLVARAVSKPEYIGCLQQLHCGVAMKTCAQLPLFTSHGGAAFEGTGMLEQHRWTGRWWKRWKEEKERKWNQLGKKIICFRMGGTQRNTTLGSKQPKKGKSCIPSRHGLGFFLLVINNQIVMKQRITVRAKPWQESQQSNKTQFLKCRLRCPCGRDVFWWGKMGAVLTLQRHSLSKKAARRQAFASLLLILVLKQEQWEPLG